MYRNWQVTSRVADSLLSQVSMPAYGPWTSHNMKTTESPIVPVYRDPQPLHRPTLRMNPESHVFTGSCPSFKTGSRCAGCMSMTHDSYSAGRDVHTEVPWHLCYSSLTCSIHHPTQRNQLSLYVTELLTHPFLWCDWSHPWLSCRICHHHCTHHSGPLWQKIQWFHRSQFSANRCK